MLVVNPLIINFFYNNRLELLTKDNISDRDRFGKDKDHLHAQLVLKDKEMNRLTLELEREKQVYRYSQELYIAIV